MCLSINKYVKNMSIKMFQNGPIWRQNCVNIRGPSAGDKMKKCKHKHLKSSSGMDK